MFIFCVKQLKFSTISVGFMRRKRNNWRSSMSLLQQFWILTSVDRIFWPIILYCIYLTFGPWMVSEVIDGNYGAVFLWGTYVDGRLLLGGFTYIIGFIQLLFCQFPLNWIYSKCLAIRFNQLIGMPTKHYRKRCCSLRIVSSVVFYFIITIEILLSIFFGIFYGVVGFFLGVFRTWSVVMNIILYYLAKNVPDNALR